MSAIRLHFIATLVLVACLGSASAADNDVDRLIAAMLGDTPLMDDLHELTDTIGGRELTAL